MEALTRSHENLYIRIVDIRSWSSDVAKQYEIRSLPQIWLYEDGEFVTKEPEDVLRRVHGY